MKSKTSSKTNLIWKDYEEYCRLCKEGLEKQSLEKLADLINSYKLLSVAEQIKFAEFVCEFAENSNRDNIPYPLRAKLKKTLLTWIKNENKDSRPFRWLSKYFDKNFTEKALNINPKDDQTRDFLIRKYIYAIIYVNTSFTRRWIYRRSERRLAESKISKASYRPAN